MESYTFFGLEPGLAILIVGRVHGNEPCGTEAILKIINSLRSGKIKLKTGKLTLVPVCNALAANRNTRNGDRNLNRCFYPKIAIESFEDSLNNILCPLIKDHQILLDLHSFKKGQEPFALIGNSDMTLPVNNLCKVSEAKIASWLGVTTVISDWSSTYLTGVKNRRERDKIKEPFHLNYDENYGDGTTEFARKSGIAAVTLECGQHSDPNSVKVATNAVINLLAHLSLITNPSNTLKIYNPRVIKLIRVVDKLDANDFFLFDWQNFDRVSKGKPVAKRKNGSQILAPEDGFIIFPNSDAEIGQEWLYFGTYKN